MVTSRHMGWKVTFGLSWIPAGVLYGLFAALLTGVGEEDFIGALSALASYLLLIPVILVAGLQIALGYLAFRK